MKVFVGGSRRIGRLNADIRQRLDRIVDGGFNVVVGDAIGADKAVQSYLKSKNYDLVEVFCSGKTCRNNIGHWPARTVAADKLKGFDFYAVKDRAMAEEASYGFMIWDGKSVGTLMNVSRLIHGNKIVVVYVGPAREFVELRAASDFHSFIDNYASELRHKLEDRVGSESKSAARFQPSMF